MVCTSRLLRPIYKWIERNPQNHLLLKDGAHFGAKSLRKQAKKGKEILIIPQKNGDIQLFDIV